MIDNHNMANKIPIKKIINLNIQVLSFFILDLICKILFLLELNIEILYHKT
jgi:hypothetical protein